VSLLVGVIHGDEPAGLRVANSLRRIASTVEGAQLWIIDTVNPDGVRAHTRKNSHGVDLNRNFPYRWRDDVPHSSGYYPGPRAASEPETRAVMTFVRRIQPDLSIWYHHPGVRSSPVTAGRRSPCSTRSSSAWARAVAARACVEQAITWEMHSFPGSRAFVVEMPPGKISARSVERQARAALTVSEGR
jgi:protein MpaA